MHIKCKKELVAKNWDVTVAQLDIRSRWKYLNNYLIDCHKIRFIYLLCREDAAVLHRAQMMGIFYINK